LKKLLSCITAIALIASMATVAFALNSDTKSKSATGYGTLSGTVWSDGTYVTSVTSNPDNAQLTITGLIQNSAGQDLAGPTLLKSQRGVTSISAYWSSLPAGTYAIYGTHGVQGGSTHPAAAVYTVTHV
jgi:hypothetical protein